MKMKMDCSCVNTTVDVKPPETERQASKFFGYNKNLLKKRNAKDPNHTCII